MLLNRCWSDIFSFLKQLYMYVKYIFRSRRCLNQIKNQNGEAPYRQMHSGTENRRLTTATL